MSQVKSAEYTRTYKNMQGVDFSSRSKNRYAYTENVYKDYDSDNCEVLRSVPGFRKIASLGKRINGIFTQRAANSAEYTVVHSGNSLYRFNSSDIDSLTQLTPIATLSDAKSSAFQLGKNFYVMDGEKFLKIKENGETEIISAESENVYVPTTYVNRKRFEQRNLLTDRFKERYMIGSATGVTYGTWELLFSITDEDKELCAVVGSSTELYGIVNIPSYATIGEKRYKVDEISDYAFSGASNLSGVKIGEGVHRIGKYAFRNCSHMSTVKCPESLSVIDSFAFKGCRALGTVYLGGGMSRFGESVFAESGISMIRYTLDENEFKKIENSEEFLDMLYTFQYERSMVAEIPVCTSAVSIDSVFLGSDEIADFMIINADDRIRSIIFNVSDYRELEGKEVTINGIASEEGEDAESGVIAFIKKRGYSATAFGAVSNCRICESFDERVFISANPDLPGLVFFSQRAPKEKESKLYFGIYDFFCDGTGMGTVSSMLASRDALLVFKEHDDGGGSIFYHTPTETGEDFIAKIYPVSYRHNGIGALSDSISFFDDPIFISKNGVSAIEKRMISLDRSIVCRSHAVNSYLLKENLKNATLAEWCGYLALGINGQIFLADSRATFISALGYAEYEWYYLTGIGTYSNAERVYRYASSAPDGYCVWHTPEQIAESEVRSEAVMGKMIYFTLEEGKKYTVYPTEEMKGGTFNPLSILYSNGNDLLFFGTDNGDLCVFNNDKRGAAPPPIASMRDFDAAEYTRVFGRKIHPYYYSFANHKMRCGVKTYADDCGIMGLTKNTVKHSLTLNCSLSGSGKIRCEVKTNRSDYEEFSQMPNNPPNFSDIDFSSLTFDYEESISLPIAEKEKNWISKEVGVFCEDFRSPISIDSICYRYTVKGRIKHE